MAFDGGVQWYLMSCTFANCPYWQNKLRPDRPASNNKTHTKQHRWSHDAIVHSISVIRN